MDRLGNIDQLAHAYVVEYGFETGTVGSLAYGGIESDPRAYIEKPYTAGRRSRTAVFPAAGSILQGLMGEVIQKG